MESVGVVIVSHSPKVAEGAADMVRQMVGEEVPLAWTGGNPSGGLGTDVAQIMSAIERAWSNFRFGPAYPTPFPNVQFPLEAVDQYLAQLVPNSETTLPWSTMRLI